MNLLKRIYVLLRPDERKKLMKMAISIFFTALLDLVGLAALLPVLKFLMENDGHEKAAMLFSLLAVVVIIVKCVLTTLLSRFQNQTLLSFYRRLSFSLFSSYYNRGLLFIRERGSNKLVHEINAMCYAFSHSLLAPICRISSDLLLITLVVLALLLWNGACVLLLFVSFIPFMCFYIFFVRKRVQEYGKEDMQTKREQAKIVAETFRGYVDIEINGAFPRMQRSFLEGMDKISQNRMNLDLLQRLPLFLSELSVVIGLVMLLLFAQGDILMLIGTFAVATFRMLPAMRSVLGGWTQIQNASCCLEVIEEGLKEYEEDAEVADTLIPFEHEITVNNVSYAYPNSDKILRNFNCTIAKGEYIGVQGMSGVGKTTLFNLLIGLIEPLSGEIRIDNMVLTSAIRQRWMKQIGYVPQEVYIFNGTLAENIALECEEIDRKRVEDVIEKVNLGAWLKNIPQGIDTMMSEAGSQLSGGQKQRIGIARALYKQASVLLLDEATSALDNATENEINNTLLQLKQCSEGLTILSIAHRESSLKYCDRVITIEHE